MDVSFNSVVQNTRQYFQGIPSTSPSVNTDLATGLPRGYNNAQPIFSSPAEASALTVSSIAVFSRYEQQIIQQPRVWPPAANVSAVTPRVDQNQSFNHNANYYTTPRTSGSSSSSSTSSRNFSPSASRESSHKPIQLGNAPSALSSYSTGVSNSFYKSSDLTSPHDKSAFKRQQQINREQHPSQSQQYHKQQRFQHEQSQQLQAYGIPTVTRFKPDSEYGYGNQSMYSMDSIISQSTVDPKSTLLPNKKAKSKTSGVSVNNLPYKPHYHLQSQNDRRLPAHSSPSLSAAELSFHPQPTVTTFSSIVQQPPQNCGEQLSSNLHPSLRTHFSQSAEMEQRITTVQYQTMYHPPSQTPPTHSVTGEQNSNRNSRLTNNISNENNRDLENRSMKFFTKRESPLDLSQRTVRRSADSTALMDDPENTKNGSHSSSNSGGRNSNSDDFRIENINSTVLSSRPFEIRHSHLPQLPQYVCGSPAYSIAQPSPSRNNRNSNFGTHSQSNQSSSLPIHSSYKSTIPKSDNNSSLSSSASTPKNPSDSHIPARHQFHSPVPTYNSRQQEHSSYESLSPAFGNSNSNSDRYIPNVMNRVSPAEMVSTFQNVETRKRLAADGTDVVQAKVPKLPSWRQSIDKEIENRLHSYSIMKAQEVEKKNTVMNKDSIDVSRESPKHNFVSRNSPNILMESPKCPSFDEVKKHNSDVNRNSLQLDSKNVINLLRNNLETKERTLMQKRQQLEQHELERQRQHLSNSQHNQQLPPAMSSPLHYIQSDQYDRHVSLGSQNSETIHSKSLPQARHPHLPQQVWNQHQQKIQLRPNEIQHQYSKPGSQKQFQYPAFVQKEITQKIEERIPDEKLSSYYYGPKKAEVSRNYDNKTSNLVLPPFQALPKKLNLPSEIQPVNELSSDEDNVRKRINFRHDFSRGNHSYDLSSNVSSILTADIHTAKSIICNESMSNVSTSSVTKDAIVISTTSVPSSTTCSMPPRFRTKAELKQLSPILKENTPFADGGAYKLPPNTIDTACKLALTNNTHLRPIVRNMLPVRLDITADSPYKPAQLTSRLTVDLENKEEEYITGKLVIIEDEDDIVQNNLADNNSATSVNQLKVLDKNITPQSRKRSEENIPDLINEDVFKKAIFDFRVSDSEVPNSPSRLQNAGKMLDEHEQRPTAVPISTIVETIPKREKLSDVEDDDLWKEACDKLVMQLSNANATKKRGRKKKVQGEEINKVGDTNFGNKDVEIKKRRKYVKRKKMEDTSNKNDRNEAPILKDLLVSEKIKKEVQDLDIKRESNGVNKLNTNAYGFHRDIKKEIFTSSDDEFNEVAKPNKTLKMRKKKRKVESKPKLSQKTEINSLDNYDGDNSSNYDTDIEISKNKTSQQSKNRLTEDGDQNIESKICDIGNTGFCESRSQRSNIGTTRLRIQNYLEFSSDSEYDVQNKKLKHNNEDSSDTDDSIVKRYKKKIYKLNNNKHKKPPQEKPTVNKPASVDDCAAVNTDNTDCKNITNKVNRIGRKVKRIDTSSKKLLYRKKTIPGKLGRPSSKFDARKQNNRQKTGGVVLDSSHDVSLKKDLIDTNKTGKIDGGKKVNIKVNNTNKNQLIRSLRIRRQLRNTRTRSNNTVRKVANKSIKFGKLNVEQKRKSEKTNVLKSITDKSKMKEKVTNQTESAESVATDKSKVAKKIAADKNKLNRKIDVGKSKQERILDKTKGGEKFVADKPKVIEVAATTRSKDSINETKPTGKISLDKTKVSDKAVTDKSRVTEKAVTDKSKVAEKAVTDKSKVAEKPVTDKSKVAEKAVSDKSKVVEKAVTDKSKITEKASTDKSKVAEKAVTDKNKATEKTGNDKCRVVEKAGTDKSKLAEKVGSDKIKGMDKSATDRNKGLEKVAMEKTKKSDKVVSDKIRGAKTKIAENADKAKVVNKIDKTKIVENNDTEKIKDSEKIAKPKETTIHNTSKADNKKNDRVIRGEKVINNKRNLRSRDIVITSRQSLRKCVKKVVPSSKSEGKGKNLREKIFTHNPSKNSIDSNSKNSAEIKPKNCVTEKSKNSQSSGKKKVKEKPESDNESHDRETTWEEELFNYKCSLRMPLKLINIAKPINWPRSGSSSSLPDLEKLKPNLLLANKYSRACFPNIKVESNDNKSEVGNSPQEGIESFKEKLKNIKIEPESSMDVELENKINELQNNLELLSTPGIDINTHLSIDNKLKISKNANKILNQTDIDCLLNDPLVGFFRNETVEEYKEIFKKHGDKIIQNLKNGVIDPGNKTGKARSCNIKIKQELGCDRPASAPPNTIFNSPSRKKIVNGGLKDLARLRNKLLQKRRIQDYFRHGDTRGALKLEQSVNSVCMLEDFLKSSYSELNNNGRRKKKGRIIRRKCRSSGFDYIRKKKKYQQKPPSNLDDVQAEEKKKQVIIRANRESVEDIENEIKTWTVNKGIGETVLHRAARLGYCDITIYCLEKLDFSPSAADNAGYTPLHEACTRGYISIAKILLSYGADVSASAKGGIRPLHEAVEFGDIEIVRLLLSYGADPLLATYSGLTPLSLVKEDQGNIRDFLLLYLADIRGNPTLPWPFLGYNVADEDEYGYDPLADAPCFEEETENIEIEFGDSPLPKLYQFRNDMEADHWVIYSDLPLKIQSILHKYLQQKTCKYVKRKISRLCFDENINCVCFMEEPLSAKTRSKSTITLIKYTEKLKTLLKIQKAILPRS